MSELLRPFQTENQNSSQNPENLKLIKQRTKIVEIRDGKVVVEKGYRDSTPEEYERWEESFANWVNMTDEEREARRLQQTFQHALDKAKVKQALQWLLDEKWQVGKIAPIEAQYPKIPGFSYITGYKLEHTFPWSEKVSTKLPKIKREVPTEASTGLSIVFIPRTEKKLMGAAHFKMETWIDPKVHSNPSKEFDNYSNAYQLYLSLAIHSYIAMESLELINPKNEYWDFRKVRNIAEKLEEALDYDFKSREMLGLSATQLSESGLKRQEGMQKSRLNRFLNLISD